MRCRRGQHLRWAHSDNNSVWGRGTEGVAVPTHKIMEYKTQRPGHRPKSGNPPPQWNHGTWIHQLPLHRPNVHISPRSHRAFQYQPYHRKTVHNVYNLPSPAREVRYLHVAVGLPTKSTWLKSILNNNYLIWTLITVKNVNWHFPESEETQRGHLRNQHQGLCSTKSPHPVTRTTPAENKCNVFINVYDPKGKMYTEQMGKLTHRSIHGKKYQMILHEIDGNSTWI